MLSKVYDKSYGGALITISSLGLLMLIVAQCIMLLYQNSYTSGSCPGLTGVKLAVNKIHNEQYWDIVASHSTEWYVQATNSWYTIFYTNVNMKNTVGNNKANINDVANSTQMEIEWSWYNVGLLSHFHAKEVLRSDELKILDYYEHQGIKHALIFTCGSKFKEGILYLVANSPNFDSTQARARVMHIASDYGISMFFFGDVPQQAAGFEKFWSAIINHIWKVFISLTVLHIVLCHLLPHYITILQSFGYSAMISWGYGIQKFHAQTISFMSYHQSFFAKLTHSSLLFDLVFWYTIVLDCGPNFLPAHLPTPTLLCSLIAIQITQLVSYGDAKFVVICLGVYVLNACVAYYILLPHVLFCKFVLIAASLLRAVGHTTERFPPILSGTDQFISFSDLPLRTFAKIPISITFGIISEFAIGFPTRFPFSFYVFVLCNLNYKSKSFLSRDEVKIIEQEIQKKGWKGFPELASLMENENGLLG